MSHGWYSHLVFFSEGAHPWVNYHTHGLPEHYGHPDFQLVLPIDRETLHAIATKLVDRVKKGQRFAPDTRVSGILQGHDVLLISATESKRRVLRVILPDKMGNLDRGSLSGILARQFQALPDVASLN